MLLNAKRKTEKIKDWTKEVVVITGGSHGIGASLGKRLTSMGAKVIVIDLMKSDYGISYGADLSNLDSIEPLVKEIIQDHKPTMLVNNVGIMISGQFVDQPIKQLQKVMNINFMSHLYMSRFMLPYFLQKNSGHIVIIINKLYTCSVMGVTGANNSVIYSASKFAISGMCESLRQETLDTFELLMIETSIFPAFIPV